MTTAELILTVRTITHENIDAINQHVRKLSSEQLNWRPNPGVWSVADTLAHLNEFSRYYHSAFVKKIENTRFVSTKEAFMSSPLGRSAWKSMKLGNAKNVKRKFKAAKGYNPTIDPSLVTGNEYSQFIDYKEELISIFKQAEGVNIKRVKIPISMSKIVRLRLGDALLYVVFHNQRHVEQVVKLVRHINFPKK